MILNKFTFVFIFFIFSINIEAKVVNPLIFGGKSTYITDVPFMALYFFTNGEFQCGASIINDRSLVFAAHCYRRNYRAYVRVGTDTLNAGQRYEVERTILHPLYNEYSHDYDIAVLKLSANLRFNNRVRPIRLATKNMTFPPGAMMMTMGFGETEHKTNSNQLLKVGVPYVSQELCNIKYNIFYSEDITDNMMCAGGKSGHDACGGDSGGPLVYREWLVGVVSFGPDTCSGSMPGVYSRISALRDFIDAAVKSIYIQKNN